VASLEMLTAALQVMNELPKENQSIEYWTRLWVNITVQYAIDFHALTGDTYTANAILQAAIKRATDAMMGNWSAWTTLAEFEVMDSREKGVDERTINIRLNQILTDLKNRHPKFHEDRDLHLYLMSQYCFDEYRKTPMYRALLGKLIDTK